MRAEVRAGDLLVEMKQAGARRKTPPYLLTILLPMKAIFLWMIQMVARTPR
jgi:hypothetical protein